MEIKFSLTFFRKYFRIPAEFKLHWCILVEIDESGTECRRLGVMLCGTDKVIDVAARNFVQTGLPTHISYRAELATRRTKEDEYAFIGSDGSRIIVPVTYVSDIYFRSVFSEELQYQMLI